MVCFSCTGQVPFDLHGEEAMHAEFKDAQVVPSPAPVFLDLPLVLKSHSEKDNAVNSNENLPPIATCQHTFKQLLQIRQL